MVDIGRLGRYGDGIPQFMARSIVFAGIPIIDPVGHHCG